MDSKEVLTAALVDLLYFKFPTRIYPALTLKEMGNSLKGFITEGEDLSQAQEEADYKWVLGYMRVPFKDIQTMNWSDYHLNTKDSPKDIFNKGFDSTLVECMGNQVACTWKRAKFEEKLEEFLKKYEEKFGSLKYTP